MTGPWTPRASVDAAPGRPVDADERAAMEAERVAAIAACGSGREADVLHLAEVLGRQIVTTYYVDRMQYGQVAYPSGSRAVLAAQAARVGMDFAPALARMAEAAEQASRLGAA